VIWAATVVNNNTYFIENNFIEEMDRSGINIKNNKAPILSYRGFFCLVPKRGLEPPRPCGHQHLKLACLPFHHWGKLGLHQGREL
jgi:hypothetical protein